MPQGSHDPAPGLTRRARDDKATLAAMVDLFASKPADFVFHGRAHVLADLLRQQAGGHFLCHSIGRVALSLNPNQRDSRFRLTQSHLRGAGDLRARLANDLKTTEGSISTSSGYRALEISLKEWPHA